MLDALLDAGIDSLKLLPFLFVTYLAMEWMEHISGDRLQRKVKAAGRWGPLWGSVLGVVPQCGFSASSASLYSGRVIPLGTLTAVFLSTSDEMLPILISKEISSITIFRILGAKVLIGMISGFLVEYLLSAVVKTREASVDIHKVCEHEHCNCREGVVMPALRHTGKIFLHIFLISFLLNWVILMLGDRMLVSIFSTVPILGEMAAALIGMIPNCASSVVITELYLQGIIDSGAMMAGLLCNAGVGMLVLFRLNENKKENFLILGMLYLLSVFWGIFIHFSGISF
ncbi:hypothetical protein D7X88_02840 [bacterium C-53]|nr:hypothetical protein [Lachnospiraceae bacterium]NBI01956.1 hypothetical protein [Lachnospiraceae bacterium]RKJ12355.1 hypothetical protein D7X88_02840 [bacterium C-53]